MSIIYSIDELNIRKALDPASRIAEFSIADEGGMCWLVIVERKLWLQVLLRDSTRRS
jgi:hypothetical protein